MASPEPPTAQSQVRLQLTTRDSTLSIPETGPILVPTSFRRPALSALVNNLLESEKPIPLEFLINGSVLRTTLDDYLTQHGISSESTLSLEYVRALIPPLFVASYEHDDWVSSVDVLSSSSLASTWSRDSNPVLPGHERILSGSYDTCLRIWDTSSSILATSLSTSEGGHESFVKAAKFLSPTQIVSSGRDRTVRLWRYTQDSDAPESPSSLAPQLTLYGHRASVDCLAVHAPSKRILSASADGTIGLWSTSKSSGPEAPPSLLPTSRKSSSSKRRKTNSTPTNAPLTPTRGPLSLLKAHTDVATSCTFDSHDPTVGYSTSWDHTLRTWDLTTSLPVSSRTSSAALLCVEHLPTLGLLAAGAVTRFATLIDPREGAARVAALTLRGHGNSVSCLARSPENEYGLVSGSHDGTVKIWDLRAAGGGGSGAVDDGVDEGARVVRPVYSISRRGWEGKKEPVGGEGVKVFGVCWDPGVGVVSCGEDRCVQVNSAGQRQ